MLTSLAIAALVLLTASLLAGVVAYAIWYGEKHIRDHVHDVMQEAIGDAPHIALGIDQFDVARGRDGALRFKPASDENAEPRGIARYEETHGRAA